MPYLVAALVVTRPHLYRLIVGVLIDGTVDARRMRLVVERTHCFVTYLSEQSSESTFAADLSEQSRVSAISEVRI